MKNVDVPSSYITKYDQFPPSKSYNAHDQSCNANETKFGNIPLVLNYIPSKILDRYRPLNLPPSLHKFTPNNYKYLLMFNGEPNSFTNEKNIQAF